MNLSTVPAKGSKEFIAALESCAGFGECHRNGLLYEIVKDGRGADGNDSGYKAGSNERAHSVFSDPHNLTIFRTAGGHKAVYSIRKGKGFRFDIHERSPERADIPVKVSRFGTFELDKKPPDPR